jgi:hypothetical protein
MGVWAKLAAAQHINTTIGIVFFKREISFFITVDCG